MKGERQCNQDRIRELMNMGSLIVKEKKHQKCQHYFSTFQSFEVGQNSLIGRICGGVVVDKSQGNKQLIIHLIVMYDHAKIINISINKYVAFIKDYELKADLSIFTYLNSIKEIELGTFVNAWIRRIQKRQNNKTFFEMYLNRQPDSTLHNIKLGVAKDNVIIPDTVLNLYQKEQMLPMNFQLLYYPSYDNPGLNYTIYKAMNVEPIGSLHSISNISALKKLDYDYNKIRHIQQRSWRDEHLSLGLEMVKSGKYQEAVECFNVSLRFGPQYLDTYIAKACALANMNNIVEGIKQIKQVLRIDPNNQRAQKYYEQFQKQLGYKHEQNNHKKYIINNRYHLAPKK